MLSLVCRFDPWPERTLFTLQRAVLDASGSMRPWTGRTISGFSCSFGNAVLLALPLALLTLGNAGMVPFLILIAVHGLGYFTVTTALLEYGRRQDRPLNRLPSGIARGLATNPIILGLVVGVAMNRLGLSLPGPLDRTFEHMQGAVTPCALFSLGASLTRCRIAGGLAEPLFAIAVKNMLMPILVWVLAVRVFGLPPTWSQAAILLAAMPTGVNVYLFAVRYGAARTCQVSRGLFGLFLLTCGLALWLSRHDTITLAVFTAMAMYALYQALRSPLGPKRILLPASTVMAASLVAVLVMP